MSIESGGYVPPEAMEGRSSHDDADDGDDEVHETTAVELPYRNERTPVPESEIDLRFDRSSGPGGQNVNKTNTKASGKWNVGASSAFSKEEKVLIRKYAGNRLKAGDEIHIYSQQERSQLQNKNIVLDMFQELVRTALTPEKERIPTKPKRSAEENRIESKIRRGKIKKERGWQYGRDD
jgi:ribosome-associated protein